MKKRHLALKGQRVMMRVDGRLGRVVEVVPSGKTSVRFIVVADFSTYRHEETEGELMRCWRIVPEDYAHHVPPTVDRIRGLMRVVDEELGGKIPYRPGHFSEIRNRVQDGVNGCEGVDVMVQSSPFGDRNWGLRICLWACEEHVDVEATPEEMKASGGYTWPAFRKKLLVLLSNGSEVSEH